MDATVTQGEKTLIFLHLPKTGGMTLERLIRRQYPRDATRWISYQRPRMVDEFLALSPAEKAGLKALQGHVPYGIHAELPGESQYITMLREPVARFVSEYGQFMRCPDPGVWRPPEEHMQNLETYLDYRIKTNAMNVQTRFISGHLPPPGTEPPYDPLPADALERARQNITNHFVVAGMMERFDESVLLMKKRLGWKKHLYYARRNTAPGSSPGKKQIPPELAERIAGHSRADVELVRFVSDLLAQEIEAQGAQFQRQVEKMHRVNHRIFLARNRWKRSSLRKVRNLPIVRRVHQLVRRAI